MNWRLISAGFLLAMISPFFAQWSTDPGVNTAVSAGSGDRNSVVSVNSSDNAIILVWRDGRNGGSSNSDIYAQKLGVSGSAQWTANGVAICNALNSQQTPAAAADLAGGAIIAWDDARVFNTLDIYAQRVAADGSVKWSSDGVAICGAAGVQRNAAIVHDGEGGAIIAWQDYRAGGSEIDVYAQRVDSTGTTQWTTDGVAVCTAAGRQITPRMVTDGAGGAVIVWEDQRVSGSSDIYAQRIDSNGATLWTADGVPVCTAPEFQESHAITSLVNGDVIIAWSDFRNDPTLANNDIYAQKLSAAGSALWAGNGVAVCTAQGSQGSPALIGDAGGGAFITWDDNRAQNLDVYIQRLDAQGSPQWTADGLQITDYSSSQDEPVILSDGQDGAILAWEDRRNSNTDIYAQRITQAGTLVWPDSGVAISTADGSQRFISMISDLNGGAYLAWEDRRSGNNGDDTYAQQVNATGQIGVLTAIRDRQPAAGGFLLAQNYPNPFNPSTTISFRLPKSGVIKLSVFDLLGQQVATLANGRYAAGHHNISFEGKGLTSGIYLYRLDAEGKVEIRKMLLIK